MVEAAWSGATDADVTVLLIDARGGLTEEVQAIIDGLAKAGLPAVLALNKTDVARHEELLTLAELINGKGEFERTFMISAETGDGVGDLRQYLAARMPVSPWLYPEDQMGRYPVAPDGRRGDPRKGVFAAAPGTALCLDC